MAAWAQEQLRKAKAKQGRREGYDTDAAVAGLCATIPWATPKRALALTLRQTKALYDARAPKK